MSRKIRTLLKRIRYLEEELYCEPLGEGWRDQLITRKELSDALSYLANQIVSNPNPTLSVLKMLDRVESLNNRPLPAFEKNAMQVVEILFNYIRENSHFDKDYYHILNSLQLSFIHLSLNDLSFLDNNKHVAVKFLERLITLGQYFDSSAGKLCQYFIHAIELLVDRLINRDNVTNQTFTMANIKVEEYFQGFNQKVESNTTQIFSELSEKNKLAQANRYTSELIKGKTEGEEMPIFLLDFFENHVAKVLYEKIKSVGVNHKETQQILTDMDTLTWSITAHHGDTTYAVRFEADVSEAMKRMYNAFAADGELDEYVKDFFIEAESIHNKKLQGQRIDYDVMISADIFADEEYEKDELDEWFAPSNNQHSISQLKDQLKEDTWYRLLIDDKEVNARLLVSSELTEELIFVNLSGEVVLNLNFNEHEFLATNIQPTEIEQSVRYSHATSALIRELTAKLETLELEYQSIQQQKAIKAQEQEKQLKAQELAEQKRKAQALALKQQQEAQALALKLQAEAEAEKTRKQQEAQAKKAAIEEEERQAKIRFQAKNTFNKFQVGTRVAYQNGKNNWLEATLTLISKTTSKHIFTDHKGAKILEPTKQQAIELIEANRLKIIKDAPEQKDLIQSLVKDRRKQLSNR